MTDKDKKQISNIDAIKRAFNRIAQTKDGIVIFNHIMKLCGFSTSSLVVNPNSYEINVQSTLYNEARKTIYYELRKLINQEYLKSIEYQDNDNEKEDANDT